MKLNVCLLTIAILGLVGLFLPQIGSSQTGDLLAPGDEVSFELSPINPNPSYRIRATRDRYLEVIVDVDVVGTVLSVRLINPVGSEIAFNDGMNYPQYAGVYLFEKVPATGTYTIQIQTENLTDVVNAVIVVNEFDEEEPNQTLNINDSISAHVGPAGDYDIYFISLRANTPVLLHTITDRYILDSAIFVADPNGAVITWNDDFATTAATLVFNPPADGIYWIVVQGAFEGAIGPYKLLVKPLPLVFPPYTANHQVREPGEIVAFQMSVTEQQVYNWEAVGVDGFLPLIALADPDMNVLASDAADEEIPLAAIQGYTPTQDGKLYLFVMSDDLSSTGFYGLDVSLYQDEADGFALEHADAISGVIGPAGDIDEYLITVEAGKKYSILVTPIQFQLDPAVRVFDSVGNEVFFNDNSVNGSFAILSGIEFPAAGEYRIQVIASESQTQKEQWTGVYVIQFAEGATFDRGNPYVLDTSIELTPIADGFRITIPTTAVADDTFPLSATMTLDQANRNVHFEILKDTPAVVEVESNPYEIFFLDISDAADTKNRIALTMPPPRVIATLSDGMPYGIAVDPANRLYVVDTLRGRVVQVTIDGATKDILTGEPTSGGTLGPNDIDIDSQGNLYLSNARANSIVKISPSGATETITNRLNFPIALGLDRDDRLYAAQLGSDLVDWISEDGTNMPFVVTIKNPNSIAFDANGEMFVANSVRDESGVYKVLQDGNTEVYVEPFAQSLQGMAFDRDGNLYVADGIVGVLYRISPDGTRIILTRGLSGGVDLAFGYGEHARTLFAANMGIESPGRHARQIIAIPTGRIGVPEPFIDTPVSDWMLFD